MRCGDLTDLEDPDEGPNNTSPSSSSMPAPVVIAGAAERAVSRCDVLRRGTSAPGATIVPTLHRQRLA